MIHETVAQQMKRVTCDGGMLVYWERGEFIEMVDMYVDPSKRRQGIGESIIREMSVLARERGVALYGITRRSNMAMRALYVKLGFHPVIIPAMLAGGTDGVLYIDTKLP